MASAETGVVHCSDVRFKGRRHRHQRSVSGQRFSRHFKSLMLTWTRPLDATHKRSVYALSQRQRSFPHPSLPETSFTRPPSLSYPHSPSFANTTPYVVIMGSFTTTPNFDAFQQHSLGVPSQVRTIESTSYGPQPLSTSMQASIEELRRELSALAQSQTLEFSRIRSDLKFDFTAADGRHQDLFKQMKDEFGTTRERLDSTKDEIAAVNKRLDSTHDEIAVVNKRVQEYRDAVHSDFAIVASDLAKESVIRSYLSFVC